MTTIEGRNVIITGASSGIGACTARRLASAGARLMIAARREERLDELVSDLRAGGAIVFRRVVDVTQRDQVEQMVEAAIGELGSLDVLINNAGIMPLSLVRHARVEDWDRMVDVNLKGVLYGTAAAIGHMRRQRSGHIVNVASMAAHQVFPAGAVYCATKCAVRAFTEGLRQEESFIRTTVVSPGPVRTELPSTISIDQIRQQAERHFDHALEPEVIAEAIAYALAQPPEVDVNEVLVRPVTGS